MEKPTGILTHFFFSFLKFQFYRKVYKMVTFLTIFAHCFELPSLALRGTKAQKGQKM